MALDFKVEIVKIDAIETHPMADRLEIARVKGWNCVVQKDKFAPGDLAVYIPIDSLLPEELEMHIFGPNSKVKLHNHRVKTIRLRQAVSQGLVVSVREIADYLQLDHRTHYKEGLELTKDLGIVKYEPPLPKFQQGLSQRGKKTYKNPFFKEYVSLANIKNFVSLFEPTDEVVITEKIHGTNFRAGWVPFAPNTLWRKILKFLGLAPQWVFVYGSHHVQISEKSGGKYDGYYAKDFYSEATQKYELMRWVPKGRIVFGEVYGAGVQKGYLYDCEGDDRRLVIFDMMDSVTGTYLEWSEFRNQMFDLEQERLIVPVLFEGQFGDAPMKDLIEGPSVLAPRQSVREGCVVKSVTEEPSVTGRKALKAINPAYLLSDPSEYH